MPTSNHYFLKNIKETTEKFFLKDKFLKRKLRPQFPYDRFLSEVKIKFVLQNNAISQLVLVKVLPNIKCE